MAPVKIFLLELYIPDRMLIYQPTVVVLRIIAKRLEKKSNLKI
jgi:hypothetical protein